MLPEELLPESERECDRTSGLLRLPRPRDPLGPLEDDDADREFRDDEPLEGLLERLLPRTLPLLSSSRLLILEASPSSAERCLWALPTLPASFTSFIFFRGLFVSLRFPEYDLRCDSEFLAVLEASNARVRSCGERSSSTLFLVIVVICVGGDREEDLLRLLLLLGDRSREKEDESLLLEDDEVDERLLDRRLRLAFRLSGDNDRVPKRSFFWTASPSKRFPHWLSTADEDDFSAVLITPSLSRSPPFGSKRVCAPL